MTTLDLSIDAIEVREERERTGDSLRECRYRLRRERAEMALIDLELRPLQEQVETLTAVVLNLLRGEFR